MTSRSHPHRHTGQQVSARRDTVRYSNDTANISSVRRFVRQVLVECEAHDVVADVELMASELVTNAIEHGTGDEIEVTVTCDGHQVTLSVTSRGRAEQVGPHADWQVAEPGSITGRGLGIVRVLADRIDVCRRSDDLRITVERAIPKG
jgi:anti-sigma regulatory factor (Ser/Thr protein kinase)